MKPVARRCAMYCAALVMGLGLSRPALAQPAGSLPFSVDGMTLDQQPAAVQAQFQTIWANKAAAEWITEHNRAIQVARATAWGFPPQFVGPAPDGPANVADTTVVPLSTSTDHAPLAGDLIDIDQQAHRMYLGHADADAIEVFDVSTSTPHWIHSIHVPGGVSGILVVPDLKKVFGGSPNGLVIADVDPNSPAAYTPLAYVYLGPGGSDELDYDPVNRKALITDPPDNIVGEVDAITRRPTTRPTGWSTRSVAGWSRSPCRDSRAW